MRNVLLRKRRCAKEIPRTHPPTGGPPMSDYKYDCVKVRVRDGIGWAALNRPEKRNAMSPALHYEMDDALARLEVDDAVKVVVVTGEGGNFSAGQDLKKFFRELETNPAERKKAAAAANRWRWERLYGYDADDRHGARLLRRRGLHAAAPPRLPHRARRPALLPLGGGLGAFSGRRRLQGGGGRGAPAPGALFRLRGRAVRGQGGRAHGHGKLCRSRRQARGGDHRARREADEEEPGRAARHQTGDQARANDGCGA